jgi:hypothetical protein
VLKNYVLAAQHALHLTRAFGAPLYRGFFAIVRELVQSSRRANPAWAGELIRWALSKNGR